MPNPSMQKRITTQLLMQDIFAQVRSIYRYIYWSDCQLYRAILNRFPDSDDILLCIGWRVGEGKVFIMIPAHLPSSHRHTWHRVTSWHLVTTPSQQRRVGSCHDHQLTIGTRTRTLTSHTTFTAVVCRYIACTLSKNCYDFYIFMKCVISK